MDFTKDDTIRPKKIDNKNNVCVSESTLCQGPLPTAEHHHISNITNKEEVT